MGKSKRQIEAARKKAAKAGLVVKGEDGLPQEESKRPTKGVRAKDTVDDYRSCTGSLVSRPLAKDVKIGNFSLNAWGNLLIQDTMIEMTIGRRYGLIGANGSGKSEFLKCLANREVPIPEHIDIYYLSEEAAPSPLSGLQCVVQMGEQEVKRLEELAESELDLNGADSELLADIYSKLEDINPNTFEAVAGKLLFGLGFSNQMMRKPTTDLSGGWRMRVALAQALFVKPTLLLLDEPTNHLDLEACVWLENYLADYPYCLICISHSQDFLNGVCSNIIHLTPLQTLQVYTGNYETYIKTKSELEVNQMKRYNKEQEDIQHIKHFIATCGTFSNLVRQAKSKQKILDKMEAAGLTKKVVKEAEFNFRFNECERIPPPALSFLDVAFSYSGELKDELYNNLNLGVDMDSRVALVGPNGAGKSTLLKLMLQELSPTEGSIRRHTHLTIGKYHQHSEDILDLKKNVLDFMRDRYPDVKIGGKRMEEEDWRKAIGRYGISGKRQKMDIGTLSDGLKTRVIFAMLAVEKPNLLLLDEPTNHLDMECIDSLADAINHFDGGLVLVSHDFRLIDQVAKEVWVCDEKTVKPWKGGIRSYKNSLINGMKKKGLV